MALLYTIHRGAMQFTWQFIQLVGDECQTTKPSPWMLNVDSTNWGMQFMALCSHALTILLSTSNE